MPKDPILKRIGVSDYNKPKRTPKHKTKSHVVVAKEGNGDAQQRSEATKKIKETCYKKDSTV